MRVEMKRKTSSKPKWQQETAMERIMLLFGSAEREFRQRPDRSRRYMELAARLAMRYNVRLPQSLKRKFCKECYMYMVPGASCMVRFSKGNNIITCSFCGNKITYPVGRRNG